MAVKYKQKLPRDVLLYVPNIICYIRLLIQIYGLRFLISSPFHFLCYTFISCMSSIHAQIKNNISPHEKTKGCFDFVDGIAGGLISSVKRSFDLYAIYFYLCSALWTGVLLHTERPSFLIIFCCIYFPMEEWFTFLCTQLSAAQSDNKHWKQVNENTKDPQWATIVFANGFKNIYGFFVVGSSWSLPFWYICYQIGYTNWFVWLIVAVSIPSRLWNTAICIHFQCKYMLNVDVALKK